MLAKLKEILVEQLDVEDYEISENSLIVEDLGADSLDIVELVEEFENEFGVEIPNEEAKKLKKVKDIMEYIEKNKK